jgi:hypothetical protein
MSFLGFFKTKTWKRIALALVAATSLLCPKKSVFQDGIKRMTDSQLIGNKKEK